MGETVDQYRHVAISIDNNLRNINSTGVLLSLGDDDTAADVPIGFDFSFYGNTYSTISVRSNGYMGFTPGYTGVNHGWDEPILGTDSPDNCIYGSLLDLDPGSGGTIYYETRGTEPARTFIVGFYDVEEYGAPTSLFTFEMILHEGTNSIELQYGTCPAGTENKTVGIENIDGTDYLALARAEHLDFSNQAYFIYTLVSNADPADGDEMVSVTANISWDGPSEFAPLGYNVLFGTDPNIDSNPLVIDGDLVNTYDPPDDLKLGEDYYWRVDTIDPNNGGPIIIPGPVWTFATESAAPSFLVQPANQLVYEFEDATFDVQVTTAGGASTFQWYKVDTGLITHDGVKYSIVSDDSTSSLTVHSCGSADEGLYYCNTTNDAGSTDSQNASLALKKPIAHWPFDGTLDEITGNITTTSIVGTNKPSYVIGADGVNEAIALPANQHIILASNSELVYGTDNFSIALWIRTTGWSSDPSIISNKDWDSGSNPGWVICATSDWEWNFSDGIVRLDADPDDEFFPEVTLDDNEWHFLVVTHDRQGEARFYEDGVLIPTYQGEGIDLAPVAGDVDSPYPTVLGQDGAGDYGPDFAFDADDVRIYNYVLTAEEVGQIYAEVTGQYVCANPPEYDLTDDCLVDLDDLAAIVAAWQNCGLFPASYCP
jgi:hypothetical protein